MLQRKDPRKLSEQFGTESLTLEERLAIILRSGTRRESVYSIAQRIAPLLQHALIQKQPTNIFVQHLDHDQQLGKIHRSVIAALYETVQKAYDGKNYFSMTQPILLAQTFHYLCKKKQEYVYGVYFNSTLQMMKHVLIAKGTTDLVHVESRDFLYYAIRYRTRKVALVHNHPSGCSEPSESDLILTKHMKEACQFFSVELVDHIIVTQQGYYSFAEQKNVL